MASLAAERESACAALLRQVAEIHARAADRASALAQTQSLLVDFAAREAALFLPEDFAMPHAHGVAHKLAVGDHDGCGLYLTVNLPGKEAAPHAHGIWCINAGLAGAEAHRFYRRTDDGSRPGHASVEQTGETIVAPGTAMAMDDHDIHATLVVGEEPARALVLYRYATDRFPSVTWFHPQFGSVRRMPSRRA